jgi:hypothetical protein
MTTEYRVAEARIYSEYEEGDFLKFSFRVLKRSLRSSIFLNSEEGDFLRVSIILRENKEGDVSEDALSKSLFLSGIYKIHEKRIKKNHIEITIISEKKGFGYQIKDLFGKYPNSEVMFIPEPYYRATSEIMFIPAPRSRATAHHAALPEDTELEEQTLFCKCQRLDIL